MFRLTIWDCYLYIEIRGALGLYSPIRSEHSGEAMQAQLIALDWGTSSLRAYKLGPAGVVLEQRALASGIMHLPTEARAIAGVRCTDGFELAFDAACGDWLDAAPHLPVIACGMVGSAQGWSEAAYRATPVDVSSLGQALHRVRSLRGVEVHIVPGVIEPDGLPNVMRGEETQVLGVLQSLPAGADVLIGLPGSHCKWVKVVDGRITHFDTFMTGELFAILSKHSILGRTQQPCEQFQAQAFDRGVHVALSADGQGFVRTYAAQDRDQTVLCQCVLEHVRPPLLVE